MPVNSLVVGGLTSAVGCDYFVSAPKRLLADVLPEEARPADIEDARHAFRIEERGKTLSR